MSDILRNAANGLLNGFCFGILAGWVTGFIVFGVIEIRDIQRHRVALAALMRDLRARAEQVAAIIERDARE